MNICMYACVYYTYVYVCMHMYRIYYIRAINAQCCLQEQPNTGCEVGKVFWKADTIFLGTARCSTGDVDYHSILRMGSQGFVGNRVVGGTHLAVGHITRLNNDSQMTLVFLNMQ